MGNREYDYLVKLLKNKRQYKIADLFMNAKNGVKITYDAIKDSIYFEDLEQDIYLEYKIA